VYLIPTTMLGFLLHMSDRYFLKHFASLSDVGLYALGYRLGEVLAFAIWAFALAWPPFVFEQRKSPDAPIVYARVSTYFVAVMGFLWLTISLLAEEIVVVMARPAFYDAYRVVPWIAAAFLFQALAHLANIGILLHRKVKYRPAIVGTAAAVNLGLNFVLVPRYGMMGAGVASCVSFFIWFVLQAMVSHRLYPIPYEYARVARLVVVGVALYAAGSLIAWGSIPVAVAGKGLLLLAAPLLLYATGFFEPGELGRLRRSVTRLREWPVAVLQARNSGR
jgi:O-antigen/teichoic acid export membrane protein